MAELRSAPRNDGKERFRTASKSFTPKQIIRVLVHHGFVLKKIKGSHHIFQHPESKRRVIIPLHHRDLPKGTQNEILKEAGISAEDWS